MRSFLRFAPKTIFNKNIMPTGPEGHQPPEVRQPLHMLEDLIDHNRHVPDEYRELILKQKREYDPMVDATFADAWKFLYDKIVQQNIFVREDELEIFQRFFRQHLQGSNLVDLGGGTMRNPMYDFAKYFQAQLYINVEMPGLQQDWAAYRVAQKQEQGGDFVAVDLDADMLAFVSQMKDGSANFTLNGIDWAAIGDQRYHRALAKELLRVTRPGGLIFGTCSNILKILEEENFPLRQVKRPGYSTSDMYIWEKPE